MSFMRVWLLSVLLLAGTVAATAQTGGLSNILGTGQSEQEARRAETSTAGKTRRCNR